MERINDEKYCFIVTGLRYSQMTLQVSQRQGKANTHLHI